PPVGSAGTILLKVQVQNAASLHLQAEYLTPGRHRQRALRREAALAHLLRGAEQGVADAREQSTDEVKGRLRGDLEVVLKANHLRCCILPVVLLGLPVLVPLPY